MNRVAQTLFGVEQDRCWWGNAAVPAGLAMRRVRPSGQLPAPFVLAPAASEVALGQPGQAAVIVGGRVVGPQGQRPIVIDDRFVDALGAEERDPQSVAEFGA